MGFWGPDSTDILQTLVWSLRNLSWIFGSWRASCNYSTRTKLEQFHITPSQPAIEPGCSAGHQWTSQDFRWQRLSPSGTVVTFAMGRGGCYVIGSSPALAHTHTHTHTGCYWYVIGSSLALVRARWMLRYRIFSCLAQKHTLDATL
jgi:hypothetical protein